MLNRILLVFALLFIVLISLLLYWKFTANDMSILLERGEAIAIRLALLDDAKEAGGDTLEFLAQVILFPRQRAVLLYCLNTNSYHDENLIREMSPRSADHFEEHTQLYSDNHIYIKRSQGERILDILGGITFFVEKTLFLKEAQYQYPSGMRYYPGEQIFEYMFQMAENGSSWEQKAQERLFRQESMLLNFFWQREAMAAQLKSEKLAPLVLDMLSTSLNKAELGSLFHFLLHEDTHFNVLEVPLELRRRRNKKALYVKKESAGKLFQDWLAKAKSKWKKGKEDYSLQILNGTPVQGLARRLKFALQNLGPRIIDVDNYEPKPLLRTVLVGRSGDTFIAKHLMELMHMDKQRVSFHREVSDVQLSLLIGNDFNLKKFRVR